MNCAEPELPIPESLLSQLVDCQRQMLRQGMRRLLVLSGEAGWSARQVAQIIPHFRGDWLWVSPEPQQEFHTLVPETVNQLLGQEFLHGVFDAREGLNAEALAAFSGVLRAGSWLILLAPSWINWPQLPDNDSRRWSERPEAIATPRFITRFCQQIQQDAQTIIWRQGEVCYPRLLNISRDWVASQGAPTPQQQSILDALLQARSGIFVLTAARGRGKSTLAGMLVQQWNGPCWVTAPGKASAQRIVEQNHLGAQFMAPDALLAYCESGAPIAADWLLIDEAAAIPAPMLSRLIAFFPRVLLTTTVQGYEGTGRGFLLKFCASLAKWHDLRLVDPIRWAQNDPLETLLDNILLFIDPQTGDPQISVNISAVSINKAEVEPTVNAQIALSFESFDAAKWENNPQLLAAFYHLLTSAHYRTSTVDLRRMLDAPGMSFAIAKRGDELAAALWLVEEGKLDPALAHQVWAGRRRPRGNLVAQSLAAHGGFPEAAIMRSRRITRIAVAPDSRRQGVASALVDEQRLIASQQGLDFLSVSFGFTAELWQFWQRCGFEMVRVGGQREASSGCFAAMALLPLSESGFELCRQAAQQLLRNSQQLPAEVAVEINHKTRSNSAQRANLAVISSQDNQPEISLLDDADWRELAGFAFASRSIDSSRASLLRLLAQSALPLPALRASLQSDQAVSEVVSQFQLSGKKALLQRWREETQQALQQLDPERSERGFKYSQ